MFATACQLHRFVSLIQSKPYQPLSCGAGSNVFFCQLLSDPCLKEISPTAPILLLLKLVFVIFVFIHPLKCCDLSQKIVQI